MNSAIEKNLLNDQINVNAMYNLEVNTLSFIYQVPPDVPAEAADAWDPRPLVW